MTEQGTPAPLAGYRVVCLALYVPVPAAARRLAALGADVTRVEPPAGDALAAWCPAWYDELRVGQRVVRLDLKREADRAELDELLSDADLLLTAFRPAALARLGLAWDPLHERFPRLCHVVVAGYPAAEEGAPGHDLTYQARAGLLSPPALPNTLLADLAGAEQAVSAALALLLARERGRGAGCARVALADAAATFAEPLRHGLTTAGGPLGGGWPAYALYRAEDGWIVVAALEPHFWSKLLAALGLDPAADRRALEAAFLTRSAGEWEAWAAARTLPVVAVRSVVRSPSEDASRPGGGAK